MADHGPLGPIVATPATCIILGTLLKFYPLLYSFLPVKMINSTALTVKVQHSDKIHPVCDDGCQRLPTKVTVKSAQQMKFWSMVLGVINIWYKHAVGVLNDVGRNFFSTMHTILSDKVWPLGCF